MMPNMFGRCREFKARDTGREEQAGYGRGRLRRALVLFGLVGVCGSATPAPVLAQLSRETPVQLGSGVRAAVPWGRREATVSLAVIGRALRGARLPGRLVPEGLRYAEDGEDEVVHVIASRGDAGVAGFAFFRRQEAAPPRRHAPEDEEGHVDRPCPPLWIARFSIPAGSRAARIDGAQALYDDVCRDQYGEAVFTTIALRVDPASRGSEAPFKLRIDAQVKHHVQCGCGGETSAFTAFVDVDGLETLVIPTSHEQGSCFPILEGFVRFFDHDHDGSRDLVVRQRWRINFAENGDSCETWRRAPSRAALEGARTCLQFARRTVRRFNPTTRAYEPERDIPLVDGDDARDANPDP